MNKPDTEYIKNTVVLLGVPFHDVTLDETLEHIDRMIERGEPAYLATANLDFTTQASRDVELQRILYEAELVLCDGTPLLWASRWLGAPLRERVAGSDLLPHLFRHAAQKGHRIFFLGSTDEVLAETTARCKALWPGIVISGTYSPPYASLLDLDNAETIRLIRESKSDILLVGMGCPKQEKWIYMNYRNLGVPVCIGIGASLDFIAGKFKRAPVWMRASGLEWVFRLMQEPRRLFKRYFLDLVFLLRTLPRQRHLLQTKPAAPGAFHATRQQKDGLLRYTWTGTADAAAYLEGKLEAPEPRPDSPNIVLDCSGVEFMDSTVLGLLIRAFRLCKRAEGNLILLSPAPAVTGFLSAMNLDRLIPVAADDREIRHQFMKSGPASLTDSKPDSASTSVTLILAGDLTAATVQSCESSLLSIWDGHPDARHLCVDLHNVSFMDSSGLGFLIKSLKCCRQREGGTLELINVPANVENVIRLARVDTLLGLDAT